MAKPGKLFYPLNLFVGQHVFDNDHDNRCITPARKPGNCLPLHKCPTLLNALERNLVKSEPRVRRYLENALCYYQGKNPIVCCEADAGPCITPEDKIGACVPLKR